MDPAQLRKARTTALVAVVAVAAVLGVEINDAIDGGGAATWTLVVVAMIALDAISTECRVLDVSASASSGEHGTARSHAAPRRHRTGV